MKKSARIAALTGASAVALSLIAAPAYALASDVGDGAAVDPSGSTAVSVGAADASSPATEAPAASEPAPAESSSVDVEPSESASEVPAETPAVPDPATSDSAPAESSSAGVESSESASSAPVAPPFVPAPQGSAPTLPGTVSFPGSLPWDLLNWDDRCDSPLSLLSLDLCFPWVGSIQPQPIVSSSMPAIPDEDGWILNGLQPAVPATTPTGTPSATTTPDAATTASPAATAKPAVVPGPAASTVAVHPAVSATPASPSLWHLSKDGVVLHLKGLKNTKVDIVWSGSQSGGLYRSGVSVGASGTRDVVFAMPGATADRYSISVWASGADPSVASPLAKTSFTVKTNANVTWVATHRTATGEQLRVTAKRFSATANGDRGGWVGWTGESIAFQVKTAAGWKTVATDVADSSGVAEVTVPVHDAQLLRAVAASTSSTVGDWTEHRLHG
ncbi:hypothetical protein QDR37_10165 [Amnibacterium sp. CER49]|uniref:hypothetical protein n=1 Tax=Amnibacterium sp. CER49 TaxID=3039161 RepID=UPI0024481FB9|nr:hypothetical protein [Amnibacterium sp. CER49]MDH2444305.1 hypothetical protein [Amnibacterium sp. CER49]